MDQTYLGTKTDELMIFKYPSRISQNILKYVNLNILI